MRTRVLVLSVCLAVAGCGGDDDEGEPATAASTTPPAAEEPAVTEKKVRVGGRELYLRCVGEGSPVVIMEAGDLDTSAYYDGLQTDVGEETTACSYDRANLGESGKAPGPRLLPDLVGDLDGVLRGGDLAPPYVLVGSSGGGYIVAGYAQKHPGRVAGLVTFDTFAPDPDPPKEVVEETRWDNPLNEEKRDFLKVENQAWDARRRIGDVPVRIVTVRYGEAAEGPAERRNVKDQKGWLVLSPQAKQVVVDTGHSIVEEDPELAAKTVLDVVRRARG
jgi:hypothetical protein